MKSIDNLTVVRVREPLNLETRKFSKIYQKVRAQTPQIKGLDKNLNEINEKM